MTSHQKGDTKTTRTDGTKSLGPLSGIRVVDFSNTFMVPYATLLMVQMGAEVIKVEEPDGDILRQVGDIDGAAAGPVFLNVNRGKRSIVLDITRPSDYERLLLLVQTADVFTHNRPAAVAQRLGIDYDTLSEVNPTLIHCGAFGYGSDGPYRDLPAYDDVIQAASGFASVQSGDGDPQYVRSAVADKTTALFVVAGALAALFERERSGMGQAVEIPMFEAMVSFLFLEQQGGAVYDPPRGPTGYKRIDSPFRHPYRTSDGLIGVMIYTDRQWRSFFDLIEKPQLSEDARFATIEARTRNTDLLYATLENELGRRTTGEWLELLQVRRIPAMRINSISDLLEDPHVRATALLERSVHPLVGPTQSARLPIKFSRSSPGATGRAPLLGEDDKWLDDLVPHAEFVTHQSRQRNGERFNGR
jgi:crotonobetainyl-CoA:carnitine CoA-transferase CaiB-like acyl-CoA transferase